MAVFFSEYCWMSFPELSTSHNYLQTQPFWFIVLHQCNPFPFLHFLPVCWWRVSPVNLFNIWHLNSRFLLLKVLLRRRILIWMVSIQSDWSQDHSPPRPPSAPISALHCIRHLATSPEMKRMMKPHVEMLALLSWIFTQPIQIFALCLISSPALISPQHLQPECSCSAENTVCVCVVKMQRCGWLRKLDLLTAALSLWCFVVFYCEWRPVFKVIFPSSVCPVAKALNCRCLSP